MQNIEKIYSIGIVWVGWAIIEKYCYFFFVNLLSCNLTYLMLDLAIFCTEINKR